MKSAQCTVYFGTPCITVPFIRIQISLPDFDFCETCCLLEAVTLDIGYLHDNECNCSSLYKN